jgi:DNA-binding NtrC family response regulator
MPRVLLVDDEPDVHHFISAEAKTHGAQFEVHYASNLEEAVDKLNEMCYDAVVIDVVLKGVSGPSLGDMIREADVNIPMAYLTNMDTEDIRAQAVGQRAFYWSKDKFMRSAEGFRDLVRLIGELVQLNPCVANRAARIDNHGHPRMFKRTPIVIPPVFQLLLRYSAAAEAAAGGAP